jgi:hypothetical protein
MSGPFLKNFEGKFKKSENILLDWVGLSVGYAIVQFCNYAIFKTFQAYIVIIAPKLRSGSLSSLISLEGLQHNFTTA